MTLLAKDSNGSSIQAAAPIAATEREAITTSSTSATAVSAGTTLLRLIGSSDCYYRVGTAATLTTSCYLPSNLVEYIKVKQGDVVHLIGDTTSGYLYLTEMN
jgi:hypothetical protein